MSLVVDASVAIKWFVEEVRSEAARAVLDSGEPLIAPDLVVPEACNAAWKKVRRGELSPEHGAAVARALLMSFDRLIATVELAPGAFSLGHRFDHPLYDCFYIALAEVELAILATDDARVLALAGKAGLKGRARPLAHFTPRRR
jgi:predicted nucleic acid-binding protein